MLDIQLIRKDTARVKERLATRFQGVESKIDEVMAFDEKRRKLLTEVESLKAEKNKSAKEVGMLKAKGENADALIAKTKEVTDRIAQLDQEVAKFEEDQRNVLLAIPNLPHECVPLGKTAQENPEIRQGGSKKDFAFAPKNHIELTTKLGIIDFERGTKLSGSGFIVYRGLGARLERALINFMLDLHTRDHGYTEIHPPYLVNRDILEGTGQLPKFEDQLYAIKDSDLFLIPTAEVPVANLHRDEILKEEQLPIQYVAYTPCFRSEAGAAGIGTRGLLRVHQFDKVELIRIVKPDEGDKAHEEMLMNAEKVLQLLGLHYRVIILCTGDMGFAMSKTYDIEVWAPGQNAYLEVSSVSNASDYQSRRMALRYKDTAAKSNVFPHILNGSGVALPRLVVALLETWQQSDGSILIPEPLQPYFGADKIV
ncbi:MAG: serine--tRNA ligase [Verrucomicrobiota bacterium]|nr:serine--tRNA ligase [Verrucomicrobiota bacterium]